MLSAIQDNFPKGVRVPRAIQVLCEYLEEHDYPISGCFELSSIGRADAESWFPGAPEKQSEFGFFGRGSSGSSFAIWLAPNAEPETSPIVVLRDDGEFAPLSTNPIEFLQLLGCGYDELEYDDLTGRPTSHSEASPLRQFLKKELDLDCPDIGADIVQRARAKYTDFSQRMRDWQRDHVTGQ